jgi:hypothetical protein
LFYRAIDYAERRGGHVFYFEDNELPESNETGARICCGVCKAQGYVHLKPIDTHKTNASGGVFHWSCTGRSINPTHKVRKHRRYRVISLYRV